MALSRTRDEFAEVDLEFHQLIGVASGNPLMRSLAAVIETALFASFVQSTPVDDPEDLKGTAASHAGVVDAIAAGKGARAHKAMVSVISLGQARIAKNKAQPKTRTSKSTTAKSRSTT
jgi:DNA-binding FadR family transcriptional regulator